MMPRLQAEEKLDAINVAAIGGGQVDAQYRMRAIDSLKRRALGERFSTRKATPRDLASMGIGVEIEPLSSASEASDEGVSPSSDSEAVGHKDV